MTPSLLQRTSLLLLTLLCSLFAQAGHHGHTAHSASTDGLVISHAKVNSTIPGMRNTAGYLHITNKTDKDISLVKASSDISEVVELHTHVSKDGIMSMQKVESISVPKGETVMLKPGGYHIMFIGLNKPQEENQQVEMTLTFSDGTEKTITAKALKPTASQHSHSHH